MATCSGRGRAPEPAPEPRWLDPDQLRTWRSLSLLLARLPTALEQQLQRDARLSYLEYYVLAHLSDQPCRSVRISALAVLVNSELSRLSHLVSRLEARGFVRREPDPDDGRYTRAVLTDAGLDHLAEAAPEHVSRVRELVFDVLSESDLRLLDDLARRVVARIDATSPHRRPVDGAPRPGP